jgi:hypothetical protein
MRWWQTWYRSVPGAVGLDLHGNTHGTFTDEVQKRFERKLHELTAGDMTMPIVAVGWNAATFGGYNLALRIRHAGYANVYWYRGGREAWEVAGKPNRKYTRRTGSPEGDARAERTMSAPALCPAFHCEKPPYRNQTVPVERRVFLRRLTGVSP